MSKALVIVESPAKARTLEKILGGEYVVKASVGHVRDLPSRSMGVNLKKNFEASYEVVPDRKKVVSELKSAAREAEALYLACDPDREGEAIAWHLSELLAARGPTHRVTFHEITAPAVAKAFENPGVIDLDKVNAQQARRILDRLVGYLLSPLLWQKVTRGLSAGRVQSVAVRLIVERERQIAAFNPEEYWEIEAKVAPEGQKDDEKASFFAELKKLRGKPLQVDGKPNVLRSVEEATAVVASLEKAIWKIISVEKKERKDNPSAPFTTSTLQQAAANRLRFSAKKTMRTAQDLYEGLDLGAEGPVGLITYMRTDSVNISNEAVTEVRDYIEKSYGKEYLPPKPAKYKSKKGAQEAHEAIRPTSVSRTPESLGMVLSKEQGDLYRLIWERFVACQMAAGRAMVTTMTIEATPPADLPLHELEGVREKQGPKVEPSETALFRAGGRVPLFDGYARVLKFTRRGDAAKKGDAAVLPDLSEDAILDLVQLTESQHHTSPPPRYNEASLVKTLEELGIGRPSTYASIISTIQDRQYVEQADRRFHATELGEVVTDKLTKHFPDIMDYKFTSHMEDELDEIEEKRATYRGVLREFYDAFNKNLKTANHQMKGINEEPEPSDRTCEKCSKPMVYKRNKRDLSRFLSCTGYPNCKHTLPVDRKGDPMLPEETDIPCEKCGNTMVKRRGRRGAFLSCSAYPKCDNSADLPSEKGEKDGTADIAEVVIACDACNKAMVLRRGRRGPFVACTGYPECKKTLSLAKLRGLIKDIPEQPETGAKTDGDGEGEAETEARKSKPVDADDVEDRRIKVLRSASGRLRVLEEGLEAPAAPARRASDDDEEGGEGEPAPGEPVEKCDRCGKDMVLRSGRRGRFLGCTGYPTCRRTKPLAKSGPRKKPDPAGIDCTRCGKPMVVRNGPRGAFAGCSGYPRCRNAQPLPEKPAGEGPDGEAGDGEGGSDGGSSGGEETPPSEAPTSVDSAVS